MIMRTFYLILLLFASITHEAITQTKNRLTSPESDYTLWEVVVKRQNVKVYKDRQCNNRVNNTSLNFKDRFYVVDRQNDANGNLRAVQIEYPGRGRKYYWVLAEDLLLNNRCLKENGISVKATVVKYFNNEEDKPKSDYYDAPMGGSRLGVARWYHIYFVYDAYYGENPNDKAQSGYDKAQYVLLGKDPRFNPTSIESGPDKVLLGWFKLSPKSLVIWNTRIGLQPNLSEASKAEKTRNEVFASVFTSNSWAFRWHLNQTYNTENLISSDRGLVLQNYVLGVMDYRLPIIKRKSLRRKGKTVQSYEVAYAGSNSREKVKQVRNQQKSMLVKKKVNVLYVVDATNTMCRYLNDLPEAINYASRAVKQKFSNYQFTWGLAVFRNEEDSYQDRFEFLGETNSVNDLEDFTGRIRCRSNSVELPEDLFRGTQAAVSKFFDQSKEGINVTMSISDVKGSITSSANPQNLGRLLKSADSHFFAINVGDDYELQFRNQIQTVVQNMNNHNQGFSLVSDAKKAQKFYYMDGAEKAEVLQGAYMKVNNSFYYKDIIYKLLVQIVNGVNNDYSRTLYGTAGSSTTLDSDDLPSIQADFDFNFPMGFSYDFRNYHMSNKEVDVYYTMGSVINEHKLLKEMPFEPMALLSVQDIIKILSVADELINIIEGANVKTINSQVKELLEEYIGEDRLYGDLSALRDMGKELPIAPGLIEQLKNTNGRILQTMGPAKVQQLRDDLVDKRDRLKKIFQDITRDDSFAFPIGNDLYRWIKLSDLP